MSDETKTATDKALAAARAAAGKSVCGPALLGAIDAVEAAVQAGDHGLVTKARRLTRSVFRVVSGVDLELVDALDAMLDVALDLARTRRAASAAEREMVGVAERVIEASRCAS